MSIFVYKELKFEVESFLIFSRERVFNELKFKLESS